MYVQTSKDTHTHTHTHTYIYIYIYCKVEFIQLCVDFIRCQICL